MLNDASKECKAVSNLTSSISAGFGPVCERKKTSLAWFLFCSGVKRQRLSSLGQRVICKAIDLYNFQECWACDKKAAALSVLETMPVSHLYSDLFQLVGALSDPDAQPPCLKHRHRCAVQHVDVLVAGFPCTPFSAQRPNRFSAGFFLGSRTHSSSYRAQSVSFLPRLASC